ncbi:MAG: nicotinamide-nucleotide amidohydrolase family protein [Planctomycetes bacterium]|nr:nicotinamide-nucleotide amidohydrolase family protein [Planctomycetota bacterium]
MGVAMEAGGAAVEAVAIGLMRCGWRLAVAESCTGGRILGLLTRRGGISRCLAEGIVAYDNASKVARLGVDEALLRAHGAVSPQVALAMADGVRRALGTEAGLSTTGIAGPEGAGAGKPVGLVQIAVCLPRGSWTAPFVFAGGRTRVQEAAAVQALTCLAGILSRA